MTHEVERSELVERLERLWLNIESYTEEERRINAVRSALTAALGASTGEKTHPDDLAVDRFAAAMKGKLTKKRDEGRGGWDDPEECTVEYLAELLIEHLPKGDPVDIGNFAMMLFNREGGAVALGEIAVAYGPSLLHDGATIVRRPPTPKSEGELTDDVLREILAGLDLLGMARSAGFSRAVLHGVTHTVWKDGIDLDEPSGALVQFAIAAMRAAIRRRG